jgi:hypothetical protein
VWLSPEDGFFIFLLDDVLFEILFLLLELVFLQLIHQASNRVIVLIDVLVDNPWRRSFWLIDLVDRRALVSIFMLVAIFGGIAESWMYKGLTTI